MIHCLRPMGGNAPLVGTGAISTKPRGGVTMSFSTVGSAETLLRLVSEYQGLNGRRADARTVWDKVSHYAQGEGKYCFYSPQEDRDDSPAAGYLEDLGHLISSGLLRPLPNGTLEVTPLGRILVRDLRLPDSLDELRSHLLSTGE